MKIVSKIPATNSQRHDKLIGDGWTALKEPQSLMTAMAASIPLAILNLVLTIGIFWLFQPFRMADFGFNPDGFSISISLPAIAGLLLLLITHEMLHLVMVPDFLSSGSTYMGITYAGGFVYTEEEIPRLRYLLITILPFVIISVLLPLVLGSADLLATMAMALILLNSMASSVDVLSFILVATQAPVGSHMTSNGTKTYWKQK
ncbi:DUF3267 domain-containing protein [Methanolobus sp.]|uniref:DUF3267 domain-containing protein n=1 Tax=Methanolobus sp. TaxID=1874737 RepID=UPI0025DCC00A|nr:DUF3267 domain-containing protein [Methanolobus sp.]